MNACFVLPDSHECSIQLCAGTCCAEKRLTHWNPACSGFLQIVMMKRLMMNDDKVFVRAGLFDETSPFCVIFDGSEFNPITTSSVSVIQGAHMLCPGPW